MKNYDYKAKRAAAKASQNTTDPFVFVRADDSTKDAICVVPAGSKLLRVVAFGTATSDTTTNYTPKLFWGDATTTVLAAGPARALASGSAGWVLEALVQLDSVNSKIHGYTEGLGGNTATVDAGTISTDLSTQTQAAFDGKAIAVGGLFSAASAANAATCDFFAVEVLAQKP